ncbi:MAG: ATP-binding protein [Undibacterium sp.]|nr:ATP-binding protein [Undibacterium sp.]MDO9191888.1 ATP-binding protein [Undibacterium sp.]
MRSYVNSLDWLKSGLFWRTFFFLALLVMASMVAWFGSFKIVERTPKAQQLAAQIVSVVTITRAALTHSAPDKRRELLFDLASNEGIRVYLLEDNDKVELPESTASFSELQTVIQSTLGKETQFAAKVNDVAGFWISFNIEDDQYWLRLDQDRVTPANGWQFLGWAAISLFLTLVGAVFISKLINDPLSRLSNAARMLAKGKQPLPLPEKGPSEIRETNASFNQMVDDLTRIESDRAVILAGISHDLRTPLARMQLEVEMANLTHDARQGMQFDLAQMDVIIGQFLDYAKPLESVTFEIVNVSELLEGIIDESARLPDVVIRSAIAKDIQMLGNRVELYRLFNNLIENGKRYGRSPGSQTVKMDIQCHYKNEEKRQGVLISVRDYGVGVPQEDITRLLRPFTRVDISRSQANGSGLGLAIVDRIVKRHEGRIRISNHATGGFLVVIAF